MKTRKYIAVSIFVAITCFVQILSTYINFIGLPITLSLIPVIIGGALYGVGFGTLLGLCFGIIVTLMVILGIDPTGAMMFSMHPIVTVSICLIKGVIAGFLGALVYKSIKNKKVAIVIGSLITTLSNTISFVIVLFIFFDAKFSAITSILLSMNFVVEIIVNLIIPPTILSALNKRKKQTI